jgi:hypothetical protein
MNGQVEYAEKYPEGTKVTVKVAGEVVDGELVAAGLIWGKDGYYFNVKLEGDFVSGYFSNLVVDVVGSARQAVARMIADAHDCDVVEDRYLDSDVGCSAVVDILKAIDAQGTYAGEIYKAIAGEETK